MNMTTLNWYLVSLNWLRLSKEQIEIVKFVQEQIGEVPMNNIFGALYWKNAAGKTITLSSFDVLNYDSIPLSIIEKLRFQFAKEIFRELFKTKFSRGHSKECYRLIADWCGNKFAEKSKLLDAVLSSSSQYFEARSYLLGL